MSRQQIIDLWKTKGKGDWAYFEKVESKQAKSGFWDEDSIFKHGFLTLDRTAVLEIACGMGRHAAQCADQCETLHLVDTSVDVIPSVKKRFVDYPNVHVHHSEDGASLPFLEDETLTAVYSYDAMVHFEVETIAAYLREIGRVLKSGGRVVLHHSNNDQQPEASFSEMTGWRNYMCEPLFRNLATRAGLKVESYTVIPWATPTSDALSILAKP